MNNVGKYVSSHGVENQNIDSDKNIHWNFGTELLYEHTIKSDLGIMSKGGAMVVETGQHTGRSVKLTQQSLKKTLIKSKPRSYHT